MWGMGPPLYMLIVWSVHSCAAGNTTILPLITYVFGVCGVLAAFGGTAATRPALAADIFGNKHVGIITAQQLSVVMPAAFAGPWIASYFREKSLRSSATELAALVDPARFKQAFGATLDQLPALLDAKTVTIVRLMELVPPAPSIRRRSSTTRRSTSSRRCKRPHFAPISFSSRCHHQSTRWRRAPS
jgi:hypothetical protein